MAFCPPDPKIQGPGSDRGIRDPGSSDSEPRTLGFGILVPGIRGPGSQDTRIRIPGFGKILGFKIPDPSIRGPAFSDSGHPLGFGILGFGTPVPGIRPPG